MAWQKYKFKLSHQINRLIPLRSESCLPGHSFYSCSCDESKMKCLASIGSLAEDFSSVQQLLQISRGDVVCLERILHFAEIDNLVSAV